MNNSASNIFKISLLLVRYHQNGHVFLTVTGMNGFRSLENEPLVLQYFFKELSNKALIQKYLVLG